MQITLKESEIKRAIIAFVGNQGVSISGKEVDVSLIAGRAPNGMSATIDINEDGEEETVVEVVEPAKPGKKTSKAAAAKETGDEEASATEPAEDSEETKQTNLFGDG